MSTVEKTEHAARIAVLVDMTERYGLPAPSEVPPMAPDVPGPAVLVEMCSALNEAGWTSVAPCSDMALKVVPFTYARLVREVELPHGHFDRMALATKADRNLL